MKKQFPILITEYEKLNLGSRSGPLITCPSASISPQAVLWTGLTFAVSNS